MEASIRQWMDEAAAYYRGSRLSVFVAWWVKELAALLPDHLKARLMPQAPSLVLVPSANSTGDIEVWEEGAVDRPLDIFKASEDAQLLRIRWQGVLKRFEFGAPKVTLCLAPKAMLHRVVELPLAVESNLSGAIGYQLDQFTPFEASMVYFDQKVIGKDISVARLKVDLRVIPKETLEPLTTRLNDLGITVHAVDRSMDAVGDGSSAPKLEGFNVLPKETRPSYHFERTVLNWRLAGFAMVAVFVAMFLTLSIREASVERFSEQVVSLRAEAQEVMALQRELSDALDAANYLAQKRQQQPVMVPLLDELTKLLPQQMWLQQVQVRGTEVTMMGFAEGSQQLIEIINESPLFSDAVFRGRVTVDPETSQERFTIQAKINRSEADAMAAQEGQ